MNKKKKLKNYERLKFCKHVFGGVSNTKKEMLYSKIEATSSFLTFLSRVRNKEEEQLEKLGQAVSKLKPTLPT